MRSRVQDARYLLDGAWLVRLDPTDAGLAQRLYAQRTTDGWSTTTVPSAWNAGDDSPTSFLGSVAWYRKDFRLPSRARALAWIARFESANYRATVWLNGRQLGSHVSGYVPFELDLPNVAREWRQPPRGARRQPPAGERPERRAGRGPVAARRLVELRRAAARGLRCARSTASTSRTYRCSRSCAVRAAPRRSPSARTCATSRTPRSSCTSPAASAERRSTSARRRSAHARRRHSRASWSSDGPSCGRRRSPTSTACGSPRRPRRAERERRSAAGYTLRTGIRTLAVNASGQLCSTAARSSTSAASRCTRTRWRPVP